MAVEERACKKCFGSGRVHQPLTADHILTDTEPWAYCPRCNGSGREPS